MEQIKYLSQKVDALSKEAAVSPAKIGPRLDRTRV